jgi:glycosyltransferase involved in cell wall biosynthesis
MKIVFILVGTEGRPKILNGDTIREGKAPASGTDQSVIMIAEYLATKGHDVTIVLDKTDRQKCRGVSYDDFDYKSFIGQGDVDILITALWFDKYDKIPFKVTKGLLYWYHMAWVYCINEMIDFCNTHKLKMGFVNISKWSRSQNDWNVELGKQKIENTVDVIIPNPIMTELIEKIEKEEKIVRKEKSSIFHAQYGRGGDVANRTVLELGWEKMYTFDYVNPQNGTDKKELFYKLLETDYFIFPLYHPNGCVYKDTFSCSVAEAIAAGVIVLTYPLGAIPEYFSPGCVYVDFPVETDMEKMLNEKVTCDAQYMNDHSEYVKKLIYLENNPEVKNDIRNRSKDLIKNNFNIEVVGNLWINLLNEFI